MFFKAATCFNRSSLSWPLEIFEKL